MTHPPVSVAAPNSPTVQSGVRFRAYPTAALAQTLAQWIGCQRFIFNGKVAEDKLFAAERRMLLRDDPQAVVKTPLDRQYAQFKDDELTPWLSNAPSQILRNGCDRWMNGKQRQLKGLGGAPRFRNRSTFNSVLITNELFRFIEHEDEQGVFHAKLELGTYASPVGVLDFHAHRGFETPKQIVVRRSGPHWWLSFSYEHAAPEDFIQRTAQELAYELDLLGDDELKAATLGVDRNVKDNCIATSDGRFFSLSVIQQDRLKRKAVGARKHQKQFSRKVKGSKNQAKARVRLASKHEYRSNVARDFSHQTSHALVAEPANNAKPPKLIGFEDLKIKNMTARPKAKQDENGKWLSNRAAQKAGLNKSILASCWGSIALQATYKAQYVGTLVLKVLASYSSQECSLCGHTSPDNRYEQRFVCQRCALTMHADTNAGCNVAARSIKQVRDHTVVTKVKKRVAFRRRTTAGAEGSGVSVEETVRREDGSGLPSAARAQPSKERVTRQKQKTRPAREDAPTTARSA